MYSPNDAVELRSFVLNNAVFLPGSRKKFGGVERMRLSRGAKVRHVSFVNDQAICGSRFQEFVKQIDRGKGHGYSGPITSCFLVWTAK
jgi:hypothetical protein